MDVIALLSESQGPRAGLSRTPLSARHLQAKEGEDPKDS